MAGAVSHRLTFTGDLRQGTRGHKFSHKRERDAKFNLPHADVLYNHLQKELAGEPPKKRAIDEDLPGLGQYYCNVSGCEALPSVDALAPWDLCDFSSSSSSQLKLGG